jgi:gliding motility-associated-like protein
MLKPTLLSSAGPSCFGGANGTLASAVSGGTAPYQYSWNTVPAQTTPYALNLSAGTYQLTVTDSKGCVSLITAPLSQPSQLLLSATSGNVNCYGASTGWASVNTGGGTAPYTYYWSPINANTPLVSGLPAGSYMVTVRDKNGCSAVSTTTISQPSRIQLSLNPSDATCFGGSNGWISESTAGGTAPYVNSWSTVPGQAGNSVSGLSAGTYTLTVTDASGCQTHSTATIQQPPAIKVMATGSSTICAGQPASLYVQASGGDGSFQYVWNNGVGAGPSHVVSPAVTTSYIVTTTDNAGCSGPPDTVVVNVLALSPAYLSMSPPEAMCIGAQAHVAAYVSPLAGAVTYSWNAGLGSGPGPYRVSPASTMTYTVSVTNSCGVSLTGTVRVQVNPLPVVSLRPQAIAGCSGTTLTMSNQVANPGATYIWTFGDGSGSDQAAPSHLYTQTGLYTVKLVLTSSDGCVSEGIVTDSVLIYDPSVAAFESSPSSVSELTPTVRFKNEAVNAHTWKWEFGDQHGSDDWDPVHTYDVKGSYLVTLRTMSIHGCRDSVQKRVEIVPEFSFYVPNAFTPNGDGINDIFNGKGEEIVDFSMIIFDRWGNLIYSTDDKDTGWDGRANGGSEIAQNDVYVYKITLHDFRGNRHNYEGSVTLVK